MSGALSPTSTSQKERLLEELAHAGRSGLRLSELAQRSGVDSQTVQRLTMVLYRAKKLR